MTAGKQVARLYTAVALVLLACGSNVSEEPTSSGPPGSCRYGGIDYANGAAVSPPGWVCSCDQGTLECRSITAASASSGGASAGGSVGHAGAPTASGGAPEGTGASGPLPIGGASGSGVTPPLGGAGAPLAAGGSPPIPLFCPDRPPLKPTNPLIDDLNDGNAEIPMIDGRSGSWFTTNDGTPGGVQVPSADRPELIPMPPYGTAQVPNPFAAGTYGQGFTLWGAALAVDLNARCPYDASFYQGVRFSVWAKSAMQLLVLFPTANTNPPEEGGVCQPLAACYDAFGVSLALAPGWAQYDVLFSSLRQEGWGIPATFNASKLIAVSFQATEMDPVFGYQIDNVSFILPAPEQSGGGGASGAGGAAGASGEAGVSGEAGAD